MNWILAQEFWLWVILGIVTVIVGKITGKTISQRIQGFFGQFIDYVIMVILAFLQIYGLANGWKWLGTLGYVEAGKFVLQWNLVGALVIRNIVLGHWFWHEDSGGTITRGWLIEKLKELWEK